MGGRQAMPGGAPGAPRGEIVALDSVSISTSRDGEFFGLLGPNGAGKTTTIGILTTRVRPTSGTALVGGADVTDRAGRAFASASASFRSGRIPIAA